MENIIHDLKTQRQGVSGGLPAAYKLIPITFYLGLIVTLLASLFFYMGIRSHKTDKITWEGKLKTSKSAQTKFSNSHNEIVEIAEKADGLAKWLEGSRPLQPVTTAIGRSMGPSATISELSFDRSPEIPAHTFMQLKIDNGGSEQIESTLASINALSYLTYSANRVKAATAIDFQATLIYDEKDEQ